MTHHFAELIGLYAWTLPAGIFFAMALAILGSHLAARDRAMQTLCVSQGAVFGVLLAMGLMQTLVHADPDSHIAPFVMALIVSGATYLLSARVGQSRGASRSAIYTVIFAVLLASGYMVSALFPALESHMSQVYFGDLATLTVFDSKVTLALGSVAVIALAALWKPLANHSFEVAVFGQTSIPRSHAYGAIAFDWIAVIVLSFSVQFLGFLFTVAALFIPTTLLAFARPRGRGRAAGLKPHLILGALIAAVGTGGGFLMSLEWTRFPTVPTIALAMTGLGAATACLISLL